MFDFKLVLCSVVFRIDNIEMLRGKNTGVVVNKVNDRSDQYFFFV